MLAFVLANLCKRVAHIGGLWLVTSIRLCNTFRALPSSIIAAPIATPARGLGGGRAATVWECETDTGWSEYGADIAARLESAFGARAAISWNTHGFSYSVDWDRMQQVNEKTGRRRGIRRSAI